MHPATRLAEQEGIKVGDDFPIEINTILTSLQILLLDIMTYIDTKSSRGSLRGLGEVWATIKTPKILGKSHIGGFFWGVLSTFMCCIVV